MDELWKGGVFMKEYIALIVVGAIYFYNNGRLAQVQPRVRRRENPEEVCRTLNAIIQDLERALAADSTGRFRANIEHLQNSTAALKSLVSNCR